MNTSFKKKFGTDGIRGIWQIELTKKLCYDYGLVLGLISKNKQIIIARDTRPSGKIVLHNFCKGVTDAGCNVFDLGIFPTPAISVLTPILKADYGVVISASHNPANYNGIKIFDKNGVKLNEREEDIIVEMLNKSQTKNAVKGIFRKNKNGKNLYEQFLLNAGTDLSGLKVVLDCCYGASFCVAPKVFNLLNANVITINAKNRGKFINNNCGALYPQKLAETVKKTKANVGFAFDGDADRVIACDEKGNLIDGDKILFIFAKYLKENNLLKNNMVVGTVLTNIAIENELKKMGVELLRSKVGDKYITEELIKKDLQIGAEQCGHVILKDYINSGDGILCAMQLCKILTVCKKEMSKLSNVKLCPQATQNVIVKNKDEILNSKEFLQIIDNIKNQLKDDERIVVRPSGTENKFRILIEYQNKKKAEKFIKEISDYLSKNFN